MSGGHRHGGTSWPGTIQTGICVLASAPGVGPAPPPAVPREEPPIEAAPGARDRVASSDLASMERRMIEQALQDARFNKSRAAQALGLTRAQLYVRMRKYGLE